jgi:ribosomal protein S18 acetylase RimI-like enzyme
MQITIQPVKSSEIALLATLSRKTFYETFHEQNTKEDIDLFLETTFNYQALQKEFADITNEFFFANTQNEIAGYLKISDNAKPCQLRNVDAIEIARIYTIKEKIGKGIGKAMLEYAITKAKNKLKKVLWLGVWERNRRAIDFYSRFGFQKFGEHVFMVGNDAQTDWLMKLDI